VRLVLIGWGALNRAVVPQLNESLEVVGVASRQPLKREDLPTGAQWIGSVDELADLRPDLVAEAASYDAVVPWGHAALRCGADVVVSSVAAFADQARLVALRDLAEANDRKVVIQPGALAGVEALAAARLLGLDGVEHRIIKPPSAWRGTLAEELVDLDRLTEAEEFFSGSAAETAVQFPKNANVAMTSALAGVGPETTRVVLIADPTALMNRHELLARGSFGRLDVLVGNHPLPDNPKTSALAALSMARVLNNFSPGVVI